MALTQSKMMDLGSQAPDFNLISTEDQSVAFEDVRGASGTVVLFICNHCPYVIHIAPALAEVAREYMTRGIGFVAINSNDTDAYPADSFEHMKQEKLHRNYPFPYLIDETQRVAKTFDAACTPDIFVFNAQNALAYRGQFDDTRPHRISSGNYDSERQPAHGGALKAALDELLAHKTPTQEQIPSMGCNIKWKPGNEP